MLHSKHHELSFHDIDIKRIFQPSESLNFIKTFRGNNYFDADGGVGLVEYPDSLIGTEPHEQKKLITQMKIHFSVEDIPLHEII